MYGRLIGSFRRLLHNERGNFAMFAAITIPVFIATASLAVDTTNVMSMKTRLQNAADATALAVATRLAQDELSPENAQAFAASFFKGMVTEDGALYEGFNAVPVFTIASVTDANGRPFWNVSVDVQGTQTLTPMARVVGRDTMSVAVHGSSTSAAAMQGALSMMLVLDKSGSMDWYGPNMYTPSNGKPKKIDALKTAVGLLVDQLVTADPDKKYVRLGAVSYHEDYYTDGIHQTKEIEWNPKATKTFVNGLTAVGGTDSSGAILHAYNKLKASKSSDPEGKEHKKKNGLVPKRIIVLMTDGENSSSAYDTETKAVCNSAKAQDMIIYSVAFMAPTAGQNLLKYCATSPGHYFDADNSDDLIRAFKNIGLQAADMVARLTE